MEIKTYFRCYDCPKHTGVNGTFTNLNEALENLKEYPMHTFFIKTEIESDEDE